MTYEIDIIHTYIDHRDAVWQVWGSLRFAPITDELKYVCMYLPTDSRYAVTAVWSSRCDRSRGVLPNYIIIIKNLIITMMCVHSVMCIHVQLLTYHWLTIKYGILGGIYSCLLRHCDEQCSCTSQLGAGCLLLFQLVCWTYHWTTALS